MGKIDCINEARKALSIFDEDEIKDYINEVMQRATEYKNLPSRVAIMKAQEEIHSEKLKSYFDDTIIAANNTVKYNRLANLIRKGKTNLKEIWIRRHKNLGATNIESQKNTAKFDLYQPLFQSMSKEARNYLINSRNDLEIGRALDGNSKDKLANQVAKHIKDYIAKRTQEMVESNAMRLEHINKDRFVRTIHDASKLLSGGKNIFQKVKGVAVKAARLTVQQAKEKWINFIMPLLDNDKNIR